MFRPFNPNPFLVNAFTLAGVSVAEASAREVGDLVGDRRSQLEYHQEIRIPGGPAGMRLVREADLNDAENVLRDPTRRAAEELFVPEDHSPALPAVQAFCRAHKLTPKHCRSLLSSDPLDATHLLSRELPRFDSRELRGPRIDLAIPQMPAPRIRRAALLVKAGHKSE